MKGRRTSFEIYWEILVFCREPKSFTSIINRCDLNSKIGLQHIEFLVKKKYLLCKLEDDQKRYRTTELAQEYLTLFSQLYRKMFDTTPTFKF